MKRFRGYWSLIIIVLVAALALTYTLAVGNKPLLGLDLQGGVSVVLQPKGETDAETVLAMSILGPIGMPQEEAVYPLVTTVDGESMNALHDYVVRMSADEMPPAGAFWSVTLYDEQNGFFIPNDRKKYSVGLNGGMELDEDGGIEIWIAAEPPEGVPEQNWLPIPREDLALNLVMRLYEPDLATYETWTLPVAERVGGG